MIVYENKASQDKRRKPVITNEQRQKTGMIARRVVQEIVDNSHGPIAIIGITGQAGAGKTSTLRLLQKLCQRLGIRCNELGLDSFFKVSSRERKLWLHASNISEAERKARENQTHWWDYEWLTWALKELKEGRGLHLRRCYTRKDHGELTGSIRIDPHDGQKGIIALEGVGIAHLDELSALIYLHALPELRAERLGLRDSYRSGDEALERWRVTQTFEQRYFRENWGKITHFFNTSGDEPIIIDELDSDEALRSHEKYRF